MTNRAALLILAFALFFCVLGVAVFGGFLPYSTPERALITGYAENLRAGNGLVFNPGEPVLLRFAPLVMILTALIGEQGVFLLALALGSLSLYRIALSKSAEYHASASLALFVAVAYLLIPHLWLGYGTASPLAAGLSLFAFVLAIDSRWRLAAVAAACATLCGLESLIVVVVVLLHAVLNGKGWRYAFGFIAPMAAALAAITLYYGADWWRGLVTLNLANSAILPSGLLVPLHIVLLGVASAAWIRYRRNPLVALLGLWAALYALIIGVVLRMSDVWYYAPIAGVGLFLAALVSLDQSLDVRLRGAVEGVGLFIWIGTILVTFLSALLINTSRFNPNLTGDFDTLGMCPSSTAVLLRQRLPIPIYALDGGLQPDIKVMSERGDSHSVLVRYAPDAVYADLSSCADSFSESSAWHILSYRAVPFWRDINASDSVEAVYYRRAYPIGTFADHRANLPYGLDLRLVGYAIDQTGIASGYPVRVRLDWQIARPASRPITVELRFGGATFRDTFAAGVFRAGTYSTYHAISAPVASGDVPISLAVIVNNGTVDRHDITTIRVTTSGDWF
jgi:hypothetical protein